MSVKRELKPRMLSTLAGSDARAPSSALSVRKFYPLELLDPRFVETLTRSPHIA